MMDMGESPLIVTISKAYEMTPPLETGRSMMTGAVFLSNSVLGSGCAQTEASCPVAEVRHTGWDCTPMKSCECKRPTSE